MLRVQRSYTTSMFQQNYILQFWMSMCYYFKNHILWFCFNRIYNMYDGCECPVLQFQIYTTVLYQHKSSLLVLQFNCWHIMISKVTHYNFISIEPIHYSSECSFSRSNYNFISKKYVLLLISYHFKGYL